ncbi:ABC transporter ATP-binding protein [Pseudomonas azotoformans]|uniref:ABC transporter ATP-binding protein n=1 Tax=Pseudomonas azotoformans TaxID=47878 RepID=A0A1V2JHZ9_PSEAZ|nr:ABC transporter ATP-binding protein [Pseudomonas azotoformans]OIN46433.1 ABC transporter ATP-binding protein [Pseudomonas azotoformans]ONH44889.1 ABC transporter ATP-binding protein [Pseudomonas azotoformans]SDN10802.1 ABC-2 type transport system ATP-binding protein [Pseudomonas azotoformans]
MIEITHLSKRFGSSLAVADLSFQAVSGEVLGLLGPNGAGKSTTLRMLTGFMSPSSGTAKLCGFDIRRQPRHAQRLMGYLPETGACYNEMSVSGFLSFIAEMRGYRGRDKKLRVASMLEQFELIEVRGQTIDILSKGFRRRIGLAQAMLHDPKILILDEPTDGLDPNQKYRVRAQIQEMARDKIVIISTHIMEEVTALCGRVLVMDKGRLLADSTPDELESRSRYHQAVMLYATQPLDVMTLAMLPGVAGIEAGPEPYSVRVLARPGSTILPGINSMILKRGWNVPRQEVERGSLGEVFRLLTRESRS